MYVFARLNVVLCLGKKCSFLICNKNDILEVLDMTVSFFRTVCC